MSLTKRIVLTLLLSIIISIIITSFVSNYMINRKFETYLIEEQNTKLKKVKDIVENLYKTKGPYLNEEDISKLSSLEGVYIEIKNDTGKTVCNSHNNHMDHHRRMMRNMRKPRIIEGNYIEKEYPLYDNNNKIGTLIIGYMDKSYLTESAIIFKETLSKSFLMSTFITTLIGFIISIVLSKELSYPIINITDTANKMRKGDLSSRSKINTNTKEIEDLSNSINYLGETLQKQDNFRKKFTSDISHELRTPLTTLQTHIEALIDGIWEIDEKNLLILHEEVDHLTKLVNELRDISKLEELELNLNKSYFNISNELEKITESFKPIFKKSGYEIITKIEPNVTILADKDKFKQIIYNLISNSYKYLDKDGKIILNLRNDKDCVHIEFKDNGIGIHKKDLPNIFNRFYRSNNHINKKNDGSGLGLTITKSLVEAHGGKITVESILGKGTTFNIILPVK